MIDIDQARALVIQNCFVLPTESVPLSEALFRSLARDVQTDIDQPPFDRSLMDGFAVRAADTLTVPVTLTVVGRIGAGGDAVPLTAPGQAVQINTGAPIPPGADAVVRIEDTEWDRAGGRVVVKVTVPRGQAVTSRGRYRKAGETVLIAGTVLTPPNLAACASAGAARLEVFRKPRVALLVTGNELVEVDQRPTGGQIRNSNRHLIEALIRSSNAVPILPPSVPDNPILIRQAIEQLEPFDLLCLTGGVSMGEYDFVPQVLADLSATLDFHKISIKPGRPTLFATLPGNRLVFGLPGNPVSAMIGFHLLVKPALAARQGRRESNHAYSARLAGRLPAEGWRQAYYPATIHADADGEAVARLLSWHGSGDALGIAGVEAFVVRPPGCPPASEGEKVKYIPLAWTPGP
jgi:molybdopterin molybdotransferase